MINIDYKTQWLDLYFKYRLDSRNAITVSLIDGFAEVFGAELPPETPVYFPKGSKFAIFTWHKATLVITGNVETKYVSVDTKMQEYLETHANIQEDRENARLRREAGPNVVVCGSSNCGKTTVCKILANYGLKMGFKPIFIDLDIESNQIVPTGCIGAAKLKLPLPNDDLNEEAICMFYSFKSSNMVKKLYKKQITELARLVEKKISNKKEELNKEYADLVQNKQHTGALKTLIEPYSTSQIPTDLASGCIINTMITPFESPERTIKKVASLFHADYIIIIDFEKTYIKLSEEYKNDSHLKLIKLPRSSGVIASDEMYKAALKNQSFTYYFHGKMGSLDTFEVGLDLNEYKLYTVEILKISQGALPTGAKEDTHKIIVKRTDPTNTPLQNRIVGVLDPIDVERLERYEKEIEEGDSNNKEEFYDIIITSLCRSLIHVNYYDADKHQLIVNATSPDGLKSKYLLVGDITYQKEI